MKLLPHVSRVTVLMVVPLTCLRLTMQRQWICSCNMSVQFVLPCCKPLELTN